MPHTRETATVDWELKITAGSDRAISIINTDRTAVIYFAITENDTAPAFGEKLGDWIKPKDKRGFGLKTGERLWIAAPEGVVTYTLFNGAA